MDYSYWDNYYTEDNAPKNPSQFALDVLSYLKKGDRLAELGCGNGRDALFFASNNIKVLAIDQSNAAISNLKANNLKRNIQFVADNFLSTEVLKVNSFNYIYSRFTLHSITEEEENILLENVYNSLRENGKFFVEARSTKDEIFGLGQKVGKNAYIYNDHYRRFIVLEELTNKLKKIGFFIEYILESENYAVYKDQNPVVIRVIAQKSNIKLLSI
ncbi:class I SAM-dependent methyltransferase [Priestia koreensis]|uniref:class I SAM-dependent methyltransferase n=1 Tax=Priestia koreensis TaxID=284581 RepID=UPI0034588731